MKKVLIRGEITADHVQQLWDAVATADDGEELGVVLDNCTGAQPWAMYAAAYAVSHYPALVRFFARGECLSAALPIMACWRVRRHADLASRFLPHGADPSTEAGKRRNQWQADHIGGAARWCYGYWEHGKWLTVIEAGDQWLTAVDALEVGLVDQVGPPPDWARELLEEGGEG